MYSLIGTGILAREISMQAQCEICLWEGDVDATVDGATGVWVCPGCSTHHDFDYER